MERVFKDHRAVRRFRSGPLGEYLQQLTNELAGKGYARFSIRVKVRIADHFGRWLKRCRIPLENLTPRHVQRYLRQYGSVKRGDGKTLSRLLDLLASQGAIENFRAPAKRTPAECLADQFADYLQRERCLSAGTIRNYRNYVRLFLTRRFGTKAVKLQKFRTEDVVAFVRQEAAVRQPSGMKNLCCALRSFFDYTQL